MKTFRIAAFAAVGVLSLALSAAPAAAHFGGHHGTGPGLDPTWNGTGTVTTNFAGMDSLADGVAVGWDGSVVAVGGLWDGTSNNFAIARYRSDGTLDPTFGNGGLVNTDFAGGMDLATSVALDGDRLVVAGYTFKGGSYAVALARYLKDGTLDPSFGTGGEVVSSFGGNDMANAVAVSFGRVVLAGQTSAGGGGMNMLVARYAENGSLDPSFNGTGWVATDFNGLDDQANALILVGRHILVAGSAGGASSDFALAAFRGNGALDPAFGTGGKVETDFSGNDDAANSVTVQRGRILAIGAASNGTDHDFAAAVYDRFGSLDASFGNGGLATMDMGRDEVAFGGGFGPRGSVVAAGYSADGIGRFAVGRWNADGTPDTRVGGGLGYLITPIGSDSSALGVAWTRDGKLVLAGFGDADFAVARYVGFGQGFRGRDGGGHH